MRAVMEEVKEAYLQDVVEPWMEKTLEAMLEKIHEEAEKYLTETLFYMGDLDGFHNLTWAPCPPGVSQTHDVADFAYDGLVEKLEELGYNVDTEGRNTDGYGGIHADETSRIDVTW